MPRIDLILPKAEGRGGSRRSDGRGALLNIVELSDSDWEAPAYTVWSFRPDEITIVREILERIFPR